MSINKSVLKSAGVISLATLCSRLLGFARDVVIARIFGVYIYAQAFVIAFKIPNLFRDLVAEGAANAAFVPVLSEYSLKKDRREFWELANVILNLLLVIISGLVLAGIILAPVVVRLIAPGFTADPEKLAATILLTRLVFPYLLLISLAVYATAILNSLRHFAVPAFAPCLLNISIISCALFLGEGLAGLASGILIGGLLQLLVQIPVLYYKGASFRVFGRFSHPECRTIFGLLAPRIFSSGIYQLNNFVDSIFGSLAVLVGEGGVAILYFAYRLIQFPVGVFSNALFQAILPAFSTLALEANRDNLKATLSFGLRAGFFVMLPASIGFMVMSRPIIRTLFEGGRFDSYSVDMTANVLFLYSVGMAFYGATKMLQSCFFALKDTIIPAKISVITLLLNIALNAVLIFPLKLGGIALATSISGIATFFILFGKLSRKLGGLEVGPLVSSFLRFLCASLGMGLVCSAIERLSPFGFASKTAQAMDLFLAFAVSLVSYVFFCSLLKAPEIAELRSWIKNSRKK